MARGIHHVTAIAGDAQADLDFYTRILGLRLVKVTVNYDDVGAYHFYFGDAVGSPGSILTFFPYPDAREGKVGAGQASSVALAVPPGSLEAWMERLAAEVVYFDAPETRFGDKLVALRDPDGLRAELVESDQPGETWADSPVEPSIAIRGVYGVTLAEADLGMPQQVLEALGFEQVAEANGMRRFRAESGSVVDVTAAETPNQGRVAKGSIHHVAFRAADMEDQARLSQQLADLGVDATEVRDRQYFQSIYFREPGGVLFEIATDGPGFLTDEPEGRLGTSLKLPEQFEPRRTQIERNLAPIKLPNGQPLIREEYKPQFAHKFMPGAPGAPTLLMLHGTGGDEGSLLPFGVNLHERAAMLSPRGRVLENGMPRFFRRFQEGVFDEESIRTEADALATFLRWATGHYEIDPERMIAFGYSNGANIASALLLLHPEVLSHAILVRAMVPLVPEPLPSLRGKRVLISAGKYDELSPPDETQKLAELLRRAGATVDVHWVESGHQLKGDEIHTMREWIEHLS
jgi:predicted esterase/catechol 2,3-dioxygenase-like lactoylglutathione lyase family enzyme